MDINKQITEAIEQNLPKAVGDTLRKRLDLIDSLEKEKEETANLNVRLLEDLEKLKSYRDIDQTLKSKEATLIADRKKMDEEAVRAEVTLLQKELEYVKGSRAEIKDLVSSLFRNLEFRKAVYGTQPFQSADGYVSQGQKDHTEDTKIE